MKTSSKQKYIITSIKERCRYIIKGRDHFEYGMDGNELEYGMDGNELEYGMDGNELEYGMDEDELEYRMDGDSIQNAILMHLS